MKLYFYVAEINRLPVPLKPNLNLPIRVYYTAHVKPCHKNTKQTMYKLQCVLFLPFHLNASWQILKIHQEKVYHHPRLHILPRIFTSKCQTEAWYLLQLMLHCRHLHAAGTTGSVKNVLSSSPYTNSSTHIQFQSIGPQNYLQHNSFVACLKSFYT